MKFKHRASVIPITFLFAILVISATTDALGQKSVYEPKKGSPERTAVLGAIISYDAVCNIGLSGETFDVTAIMIHGNWAFVNVERSNLPDAGQGTHLAFLQKTGTTWKVAWSDFNDKQEVGVNAITRLRKKNKDWSVKLADFAMAHLAG